MAKLINITEKTMIRPKRFFRSVRLESDIKDINNLRGYTLTNHVLHVLGRIEEGLHGNTGERAWTLTGPYGSGKSAFALFLANLLSNTGHGGSNLAYELLVEKDPRFAGHFSDIVHRGLYPIALTLRRAPLAQSILEGLIQSLQKERQTSNIKKMISEIKGDLSESQLDSQTVIKRINSFIDIFSKKYSGMLLILDELGKSLEYAARHTGEDVYLLQELAEYATRSKEQTFLLVGILHQSFEQYGEYLDYAARQEWAKVQGRFGDIAFIETPDQQIRLAVQAINSLVLEINDNEKNDISEIAEKMFENGFVPNGIKQEEVKEIAVESYPLHLSVLNALPYLFKRFAQNQRSLFAYLLSNEPYGLQELSEKKNEKMIRLPDLFDYFSANVSGNIAKQLYGRRWHEINDALERVPDLTIEEVQVLKTIGLLDLLGETGFMSSTYDFISLALFDVLDSDTIRNCLTTLQKKSLIVYRRYNQTYKIWEGSDVDIETRLEEGHRKTRGFHLAEDLQRFLPNRPMVARKHSHEVGAMRYFELRYLDSIVQAKHLQPGEGMDGVIVCCLPGTQGQITTFTDWTKNEEISSFKNILIVVPQQIGSLRDAASELRAIHWVWQNTPELRDDRIARRELAERTALFEQILSQAVQQLLDPRPEPLGTAAKWFYMGQKQEWVQNLRGISELLSAVMDNVFSESPRIKNELINRRVVSSAASAARRNIVERMLMNARESSLGIKGYPPERSIYESVLKVSGLHRDAKPYWALPSEEVDQLNLLPTFRYMERKIFSSLEEPYSVESLLKELTMPPYGIMPGVFPILLVAFMLSFPDEVSLYRDGIFIPEPNIADFEVLMRRPEFFSVAGSRLSGERLLVVERISKGLNVRPATLAVVRAIITMVRSLPDHAWRTRKLPERVLKLRTAIEQARSPERLLFIDIPKALDEAPFKDDAISDGCIEQFFNKLNQALQTWQKVTQDRVKQAGDTLLIACQMPTGNLGWQELIKIAQYLDDKPLDDALKPFIKRLTAHDDQNAVIDSVLALVANRPPRSWTDYEVERFPSLAKQLGGQFVTATYKFKVLSTKDEVVCDELVKQLKKQLSDDISPHIVKVALSRLLQDQE